jgi:hypothetical protein
MHGWVGFAGSAMIAAIGLGRPDPNFYTIYPSGTPSPAPTETWTASIDSFEVPPAGWVMP